MSKLLQYNGIKWVEIAKDGKNAPQIEEILAQIPIPKNGYTPKKGVDYFDGKDGSPDTGEQIIQKINTSESQIDISRIKGLPGTPLFRGGRLGRSSAGTPVNNYDISSLLDGVTKTFTIPANSSILMVQSSSVPFTFRKTTDFTSTSTTITFTAAVDAPSMLSSGQSINILYVAQ